MQENKDKNLYLIPLAIVVAGLLIAGAVLYSTTANKGGSRDKLPAVAKQDGGAADKESKEANDTGVSTDNVDIENEPRLGSPNAPLIMAYWFDYQCPFCKMFEQNTLPLLIDQYVKTGKMMVVFKDFQFLGPDSQIAGKISKAVWELYPDQWFRWQELMFKNQDEENKGFGKKEDILKMTKEKIPEINVDKISALIDEKDAEYQKEQDEDKSEGTKLGVAGTPGFIIGSQRISGARPLQNFIDVIEEELKKLNSNQ
jgi:protein-disulfide isomerase